MEIIMCDSSRLACERHRERKCVAEGCGVDGGISGGGGVQEGMNVAQEHLRAQLRRSWRKEKKTKPQQTNKWGKLTPKFTKCLCDIAADRRETMTLNLPLRGAPGGVIKAGRGALPGMTECQALSHQDLISPRENG